MANMTKKYASVILDSNISKPLDYEIPTSLLEKIKPGIRVKVPLRGHLKKGYIFSIKDISEVKNPFFIDDIISEEVISEDLFKLAVWMSRYYLTSLSKILTNIVPTSVRKNIQPKFHIYLTTAKTKKELATLCASLRKKSPSQANVLDIFLKTKKGILLSDLIKDSKITTSPINTLIKKNIIKSKKIILDESSLLLNYEYFQTPVKKLSQEQKICLDKITSSIENNLFDIHLIHGITGSGKTEVYMQAISHALKLDKTVIMLVPEIALTSQTIERFRSRFKEKIAIMHHKRSYGEKHLAWNDIKQGKAKIVIGARSAIFSPVQNLGLIIVDEEHDSSYKQTEEMPSYNAKHIAIIRGKFANAPIVLGSATPALESYYNAIENKYILSKLTTRPTKASLPSVKIIDMKTEFLKANGFTHFSSELLDGIISRHKKGEQTILFLNRRGFNSFLICKDCRNVIKCPHCDVSLTFHKKNNILMCHSCGFTSSPPSICPKCKSKESIEYKGFGTEHIQRSLKAIFPEIRTLRIDQDTTRQKHSHEDLLKQFRSGKADVLIGTQMIVKGLHFPAVTLVGVLNSDSALNIPDFRSSERVFQLLCQVAGRAGREDLPGEVIIQTFMPNNPTLKLAAKQDFETFFKEEIEIRKLFDYPPFSHIVKILFSGKDENKTFQTATDFRNLLLKKVSASTKIHALIPPAHCKIKDLFRFQILLRSKKITPLLSQIKEIKENFLSSSIKIFIDIDPINTFF